MNFEFKSWWFFDSWFFLFFFEKNNLTFFSNLVLFSTFPFLFLWKRPTWMKKANLKRCSFLVEKKKQKMRTKIRKRKKESCCSIWRRTFKMFDTCYIKWATLLFSLFCQTFLIHFKLKTNIKSQFKKKNSKRRRKNQDLCEICTTLFTLSSKTNKKK